MSILDLDAFIRAPLRREGCDFVVVPEFVRPECLPDITRDYARIDGPGSFNADDIACGPAFAKLIAELRNPCLGEQFSAKFNLDLSRLPMQIGVRRFAQLSDGKIHNDSRSKVVTALIYLNETWSSPGGRLRLLRDPGDIDSQIVEIEPAGGTLFAFRRSGNSFHGFKTCEGERRSIQMYWVTPKRGARGGPKRTPEFLRRLKRLFKTG